MGNEVCIIKINDEEISDIYPDILSVEIEDDYKLAATFKIKLAIQLQSDGEWTYLDDDSLSLWNRVEISAGFPDNVIKVINGYITNINPYFAQQITNSYLEVRGMDASVLMDREEKLKDWPNRKDSDIATEIFADYGLTPDIEDTGAVHDEAVSTIIQRESDIKFLKRLAQRNGYECFVQNSTGYFRRPVLNGTPQKVLAAHFGNDTNISFFQASLNALRPTIVGMYHIDAMTKEIRSVTIDSIEQKQLGQTLSSELIPSGVQPTRRFVKQATANSQQEMEALCQALYDEAEWLLKAKGEIISNLYQDVLKARELVTIKGVGRTYSGTYYVTNVRHNFTQDGYTQHFEARKNALSPDGTEIWGEGGSLMSAVV